MTTHLAQKASMMSLNTTRVVSSRPRMSRNCSNCTCSPGLLSRQNRRSSIIAKRMSLRRLSSSSVNGLSRSNSRRSLVGSELCETDTVKERNTSARLAALRSEMKTHDIAVYVIPSEDEHQSEYVSASDQRRSFISGFSGSAGVAVITRDLMCMNTTPEGLSALSTDGRYFVQAEEELDFNWRLLRQNVKGEPTWQEWAIQQAIRQALDTGLEVKIGIDPKLISYGAYIDLKNKLKEETAKEVAKSGLKACPKVDLVAIDENLVDTIWENFETAPVRKHTELLKLDDSITGESASSKLDRVREKLHQDYSNQRFIVNSLDEIAWVLNLRGFDIEYNPVFYSYLLISDDKTVLYCDLQGRLSEKNLNILDYLKEINVEVRPYDQFYSDLKKASADVPSFLVPQSVSLKIVQSLKCDFKIIDSPIELFKSIKNKTEIQNFKLAHSKDGVASIKFFAWLEDQIKKGEMINEYEAAVKQEWFRSQQRDFVALSFETISSTGKNSAIIHYSPSVETSPIINPNEMYLNDSGAQYLQGTTDITRTIHFATPTQEQIDNYTRVLKGNLAIETLKFPKGTNGYQIDAIARQFLWSQGLDYKHGTSHGLGAFLNVHEGPIGIGFRPSCLKFSLQAGNVISNEPGYYKTDEYGIRIENVVCISDAEFDGFLQTENITRVPYCRNLINASLLTEDEIALINKYHHSIFEEFKGVLDHMSYSWLKKETLPL